MARIDGRKSKRKGPVQLALDAQWKTCERQDEQAEQAMADVQNNGSPEMLRKAKAAGKALGDATKAARKLMKDLKRELAG